MLRVSFSRWRTSRVVAVAATLLAASVVVVLASTSAQALVPGSPANFTIQGSVTGLTPGIQSSLVLTAQNYTNIVPITVTSVTVTVASVQSTTTTTSPCVPTELTFPGATYSAGTWSAPVSQLVLAGGTAPISLPILLAKTAPNDCQVATFNFTYGGTANVVAVPALCTGTYNNTIFASPTATTVTGTKENDFIFAYGATHGMVVSDLQGNDCLDVGDWNNTITDGSGNDVVLAGNGTNTVKLGNGNDVVVVGAGSNNALTVGSGNDSVTVGSGSYDAVTVNSITLGNGSDVVRISGGSHDLINGGNNSETIYLGAGTYNTYNGQAHDPNVCHLPVVVTAAGTAPGTAAYYHDTIINCTVVSP